jgi:two-component system chemotaxis response regulator CheY
MSDSYNILVVEDSPTMRQLICFALKKLRGAVITEANDGLEGLSKLKASSFDLIIADINMPIMDGLKLVDMVRKDDVHKDTPIVIVTTESAEEDRQRAMNMGVNAYITKPIQSAQVINVVRELLEK